MVLPHQRMPMPKTTTAGRPQMGFHVLQAAADDFLACQVEAEFSHGKMDKP